MSEMKNNVVQSDCKHHLYGIIIFLLAVISVLSFFLWRSSNVDVVNAPSNNGWTNTQNVANTQNPTETPTTASDAIDPKDLVIQIIGDKRCSECATSPLVESLKQAPFLTWAQFQEMDFSDEWVKDLVKNNDIKALPAVLLNSNKISDTQFISYLQATPTWLYTLNVWASFDPFAEICDNKIDDNGDNKVDCDDPTCWKNFTCAPKVDKPVADLYVMSYCPYGLQAQKGYLEVMSKLWKVADINVKFVPYIMHEQKEADENVVQYCIQKEQKDKYLPYLNCFLKEEWKGEACKKEAKIDEAKLTACITATKKEFQVDEKMKDTSKQFPDFDIDKTEALAAGVQGSPSFVVNGILVDKIGRSAKSYADAICSTFKNKPKECEESFQDISFDPMFGFTTGNGAAADSGCGQ